MSRPTPKAPAVAAADDLADLHSLFSGDDGDSRAPEPLNEAPAPESEDQAQFVPLASPSDREGQRALTITAWHLDTTAVGFLHRGGMCGCRYIANVALDAVLPVQPNDDTDADASGN